MRKLILVIILFLIPNFLFSEGEKKELLKRDTTSRVKDPFIDKDGDGINDLLKRRKKKQKVVEDVFDVLDKFLEKQSRRRHSR
jgi:hypothetical protein